MAKKRKIRVLGTKRTYTTQPFSASLTDLQRKIVGIALDKLGRGEVLEVGGLVQSRIDNPNASGTGVTAMVLWDRDLAERQSRAPSRPEVVGVPRGVFGGSTRAEAEDADIQASVRAAAKEAPAVVRELEKKAIPLVASPLDMSPKERRDYEQAIEDLVKEHVFYKVAVPGSPGGGLHIVSLTPIGTRMALIDSGISQFGPRGERLLHNARMMYEKYRLAGVKARAAYAGTDITIEDNSLAYYALMDVYLAAPEPVAFDSKREMEVFQDLEEADLVYCVAGGSQGCPIGSTTGRNGKFYDTNTGEVTSVLASLTPKGARVVRDIADEKGIVIPGKVTLITDAYKNFVNGISPLLLSDPDYYKRGLGKPKKARKSQPKAKKEATVARKLFRINKKSISVSLPGSSVRYRKNFEGTPRYERKGTNETKYSAVTYNSLPKTVKAAFKAADAEIRALKKASGSKSKASGSKSKASGSKRKASGSKRKAVTYKGKRHEIKKLRGKPAYELAAYVYNTKIRRFYCCENSGIYQMVSASTVPEAIRNALLERAGHSKKASKAPGSKRKASGSKRKASGSKRKASGSKRKASGSKSKANGRVRRATEGNWMVIRQKNGRLMFRSQRSNKIVAASRVPKTTRAKLEAAVGA